jgi:deoxyribonuclease-1
MLDKVYFDHRKTLYCNADFTAHKKIIKPYGFKMPDLRSVDFKVYDISSEDLQRKAERMEWEHIVPAQNFGKTFPEWSKGHKNCVSGKGKAFKGRGCAEQESEDFRYMYADMYNLYPSIGAVNYLRAHFSPTQFEPRQKNTFGACAMKISHNKMEPPDEVKGLIARTYLYMQSVYPRYRIGEPAESVLKAWAKKYPVTKWECARAFRIEKVQGNANNFVKKSCEAQNWYNDGWAVH